LKSKTVVHPSRGNDTARLNQPNDGPQSAAVRPGLKERDHEARFGPTLNGKVTENPHRPGPLADNEIDIRVPIEISEHRGAVHMEIIGGFTSRSKESVSFSGHHQQGLFPSAVHGLQGRLAVHMTVDCEQILVAVVIHIEETAGPTEQRPAREPEAPRLCSVVKELTLAVDVQRVGVGCKIRREHIRQVVAVEISNRDTHGRLHGTVACTGNTAIHAAWRECRWRTTVVHKELVRHRIVADQHIWSTITGEIENRSVQPV